MPSSHDDIRDGSIDLFGEVDGIELFQQTSLFTQLNFDETRRLAALAKQERRAKGEVIVEQNSLGQALYIIRSGEVAVLVEGESGERVEVAILGPGAFFGEMSLVDDLLSSADVEARCDLELLVIPRSSFEALLASDDSLALKVYRSFCKALSNKLRVQTQKAAGSQGRA